MMNSTRMLVCIFALMAPLAACSSDTNDNPPTAGTSGASGSAGSGGSAGTGGVSGTAGMGGSAGTGGDAGSAGSGGKPDPCEPGCPSPADRPALGSDCTTYGAGKECTFTTSGTCEPNGGGADLFSCVAHLNGTLTWEINTQITCEGDPTFLASAICVPLGDFTGAPALCAATKCDTFAAWTGDPAALQEGQCGVLVSAFETLAFTGEYLECFYDADGTKLVGAVRATDSHGVFVSGSVATCTRSATLNCPATP